MELDTETNYQKESIEYLKNKILSLNNLYNKNGKLNSNVIKCLHDKDKVLIKEIYPEYNLSQIVHCLKNNSGPIKCVVCKNIVTCFQNGKFSKFCSLKCSRGHSESNQKRRKTKLKKYGCEYYNNRQKTEKTNLKRYGKKTPAESSVIKQKISSALKKTYKTNHNEILKKRHNTNLKKYGRHPNATFEINEKRKKQVKAKYGVSFTTQIDTMKEKTKETNLKKYGVDSFSKTDKFKNLMITLNAEKTKKYDDNFLNIIKNIDTDLLTRAQLANQTNLPLSTLNHKIQKFNIPIKNSTYISQIENEIEDFLNYLGIQVEKNNRKILNGKELDILIPNNNLAIEINGIYWHSEIFKNKKYHIGKTNDCLKHNIQLLHIFDTEWNDLNKREIWKSIIKSKLNLNEKIYARKCQIKNVSTKVAKNFCEHNHLHGFKGGKIKLGLYYNNQLIQLIILGKSRFNKNYEWEIIRSVTKKNHTVLGGLSRLISKIKGNIITYADIRYSTGIGYKKSGMKLLNITPPNYYYVNKGNLESRLKYQKHKLPKLLENFNPELTEWENMKINGFTRIWDCGNYCFERKY